MIYNSKSYCEQAPARVITSLVLLLWSSISTGVFVNGGIIPPSADELESVHKTLLDQAGALPLHQFEADQVLFQRWNSEDGGGTTDYWHPKFYNGQKPVYTREENDQGKEVILLTQDEDKLNSHRQTKQTYVLLRKAPDEGGGEPKYYPMFAYLRTWRETDNCPHFAFGSQQKCIEWDNWVMRSKEENTIWADCSSTVFLSCGFNATVFESITSFKAVVPSDRGIAPTFEKVAVPDNLDDYKNYTDYDFFDDLHRKPGKAGRTFGEEEGTCSKKSDCSKSSHPVQFVAGGNSLTISTSSTVSRTSTHVITDVGASSAYTYSSSNSLKISGTFTGVGGVQKKKTLTMKKPNYKNYQPIYKSEMTPYRLGYTAGIFYPMNNELDGLSGKMYVFGPGSLDVFKADEPYIFGDDYPDDRGVMGTYTAERSGDHNNLLEGILIPINGQTAYFIRNGLTYPATYLTTDGSIPETRGFVLPLKEKRIDLFFPDSYVANNFMLNQPLSKPLKGKSMAIPQWAKEPEYKDKTGTLLPRRWGPSIMLKDDTGFIIGQFESKELEGVKPRVYIVPGSADKPTQFFGIDEPIELAKNGDDIKVIKGKVKGESGGKSYKVLLISMGSSAPTDDFLPDDFFVVEPVTFSTTDGKYQDLAGILELTNGEEEITEERGADIRFPTLTIMPPSILTGSLKRKDGTTLKGQLTIDSPLHPFKFTLGTGLTSKQTKGSLSLKYPYAYYSPLGSLDEALKYIPGEDTGSFTPDDKDRPEATMKIVVFGVDRLDILVAENPIFGVDYPDEKALTGLFTPSQSSATSGKKSKQPLQPLHGILIPIDAKRAALFRDGLGYPCVFQTQSKSGKMKEYQGFYGPSMKTNAHFFYPESYKTFRQLKLSPLRPLSGQLMPGKGFEKMFPTKRGTLLPRMNGPSVFVQINGEVESGTFHDNKNDYSESNIIHIPGMPGRPDEFYPINEDVLPDDDPHIDGMVTLESTKQELRATVLTSPYTGVPDLFVATDLVNILVANFTADNNKDDPIEGYIISDKGLPLPPKIATQMAISEKHEQQFPIRLLGTLTIAANPPLPPTRGFLMINTAEGVSYSFTPVVTVSPAGGNTTVKPKKSQYPTYKQIGSDSGTTSISYVLGETTGVFKADDKAISDINCGLVIKGVDNAGVVMAHSPTFGPGRNLPIDKATAGTYIPDGKYPGTKPIHGVLIPIDDVMAYLIRDDVSYFAIMQTKSGATLQGFVVPLVSKSVDYFFPESLYALNEAQTTMELSIKMMPEMSTVPETSGKLMIKKTGPSVFISAALNGTIGKFEDIDSKYPPVKVNIIPGQNGRPTEYYPIDIGALPLDKGVFRGKIKSGSTFIVVAIIPKSSSDEPSRFILEDDFNLIPIQFEPDGKGKKSIDGHLILPVGGKIATQEPIEIAFSTQKMTYPMVIQGTLNIPAETSQGKLKSDKVMQGSVLTTSAGGPHQFIAGKEAVAQELDKEKVKSAIKEGVSGPVEQRNDKSAPTQDKYPFYVKYGASQAAVHYRLGVLLGQFTPDKENNKKPVNISVHTPGLDKLENVESEEPIFGTILPDEKGTEGTFTPDPRKGHTLTPTHGILIPIDPHRALLLRDGIAFPTTFASKNEKSPSLGGFVVPSMSQASEVDNFYPESYVNFMNTIKKRDINGTIKLDNPTEEMEGYYPFTNPGKLILRPVGPSKFIPETVTHLEGEFKRKTGTSPKCKVIVIRGLDGKKDEFIPIDDVISDTASLVAGVIIASDKETEVKVLPGAPGAADEILRDSDGKTNEVTMESKEADLASVKAIIIRPEGQSGPLTKPIPIIIPEGIEILPVRIHVKLTIADGTIASGLLASDSLDGPFTFYPNMQNPAPTKVKPRIKPKAAKLDPTAEGKSEFEVPGTQLIDNEIQNKSELAKKRITNKGDSGEPKKKRSTGKRATTKYPNFHQWGLQPATIEYRIGTSKGTFSPDYDGRRPVTVYTTVKGVDKLDIVEGEEPLFLGAFPDDEGTLGTYTPEDSRGHHKPVRGVLIPVSDKRGYIIREALGYTAKFVPNAGGPKNFTLSGFVLPPLKRNKQANNFILDSLITIAKVINQSESIHGKMIPDRELEHILPAAEGVLLLRPIGPSIFMPAEANPVKASFQENPLNPEKEVWIIPGKPDEFYSVMEILDDGRNTIDGVVKLPDGTRKRVKVLPPSEENFPDLMMPGEDLATEPIKMKSSDPEVEQRVLDTGKMLRKPKNAGQPIKDNTEIIFEDSEYLPTAMPIEFTNADGTIAEGYLEENYPDGPYTFFAGKNKPQMNLVETSDRAGGKSKYPTYSQNLSPTTPPAMDTRIGVSTGTVTPDKGQKRLLPAVSNEPGGDRLEVIEFEEPVFGKIALDTEAMPATFTPEHRHKPGKPVHGVIVPINEKRGYLIPDDLAYSATFSPKNKKKCPEVKGFVIPPPRADVRDADYFVPESYTDLTQAIKKQSKPTFTCEGKMIPDEEAAQVWGTKLGKIIIRPEGTSIFLSNDINPVLGVYESLEMVEGTKPVNVFVIPAKKLVGKPVEIYSVEDVPAENQKPIKGVVTAGDLKIPVSVLPMKDPNNLDHFVVDDVASPLLAEITADDKENANLNNLPAYAIRPKDSTKGRPTKAFNVIIPILADPAQASGKPFRAQVTLKVDEDKPTNGLLMQDAPGASFTFLPGMRNPSLRPVYATLEPNADITVPTKHPEFVQYGSSDSPVEYRVGVSKGVIVPDDGVKKRLAAVTQVAGVDKLDIVECSVPIFGHELPKDEASLATYIPDDDPTGYAKPVHGIVVPIDEQRGYIIRDGIGYTATFIPDKKDSKNITGFIMPSLSGSKIADNFIPESYIFYNDTLKDELLVGTLAPDDEVEAMFPPSKGKLVVKRQGPSTFLSDEGSEDIEGIFVDDENAYPPTPVTVIPGVDGKVDEYYPTEDLIPNADKPITGKISTPVKNLPVIVIPKKGKFPPIQQIYPLDKVDVKEVTFETEKGVPVKAYIITPKGYKGVPKKPVEVVVLEDRELPSRLEVSLELEDGTKMPGLLVASTPHSAENLFHPGIKDPSPEELNAQGKPKKHRKKPTTEQKVKDPKAYASYVPLGVNSEVIEYTIGDSVGIFVEDTKPKQTYPVKVHVLGEGMPDILVADEPIFGDELPDQFATVGTYIPEDNDKHDQKPIHGVLIPVDASTAFIIRDGLGFVADAKFEDSPETPVTGFFLPLSKHLTERFYPESLVAWEPLREKLVAVGEAVAVEMLPDETARLTTPAVQGKLALKKFQSIFIGKNGKDAVFEDDEGKQTFKVKYVKAPKSRHSIKDEYIPNDKDLPRLESSLPGKIKLENGKKVNLTAICLPDDDFDQMKYVLYATDRYSIKSVKVSSNNDKIKNEPAYLIIPKSDDGSPTELIFIKFIAHFPTDKYYVTMNPTDMDSTIEGFLTTVMINGPHLVTIKDQVKGSKDTSEEDDDNHHQTEIIIPKVSEVEEDDDDTKYKNALASKKKKMANLIPKLPTPMLNLDDGNWPSTLAYEPNDDESASSDTAVAVMPVETAKPKKPQKAVQAIILPFDATGNRNLTTVRGRIPAMIPKKGHSIFFIPHKDDLKEGIDYYRGYLRIPGNDDDLAGRLEPPEKISAPPKFMLDPENSEAATFFPNDNPRLKVPGYLIIGSESMLFNPDDPDHDPSEPTTGVIRRPKSTPLSGILIPPEQANQPCIFKEAGVRLGVSEAPAHFYPDDESAPHMKGNMKGGKFTPNHKGKVEAKRLPLHGLVVYESPDMAPEQGFLDKDSSGLLVFTKDSKKFLSVEFTTNANPDTIILGVYIPPEDLEEKGTFIHSDFSIPPPQREQGVLTTLNSLEDPIEGELELISGNKYRFIANAINNYHATFYPDLDNDAMTGNYFPQDGTRSHGEFHLFATSRVTEVLPTPGQLISNSPSLPQVHGVLKKAPTGSNVYIFTEDSATAPPEHEVCFVSVKEERKNLINTSSMSINIRGTYYYGLANITTFIPVCGVVGHVISNKFSPIEPAAMKFEGRLSSHGPLQTASGETYHFSFVPNYNIKDNTSPDKFPTKTKVSFFPIGSIVSVIKGHIVQINEYEWALVTGKAKVEEGKWKPPAGVHEFVYDNTAQLVVYDSSILHLRRQERDNFVGKKVKGGYYVGEAKVKILIPEGIKSGAMFVISDEDMIHGYVTPLGRGERLRFYPDDENEVKKRLDQSGGVLEGGLDPDESLSVNGKTPNNRIHSTMTMKGGAYYILPDLQGQWGYFIPGRKGIPKTIILLLDIFETNIGYGQSAFFSHDVYGDGEHSNTGHGFGRALGEEDEQGRCIRLTETYYVHEPNGDKGVVLQICRVKDDGHVEISQRQGYYPFSEVNDDEMDEKDNIRVGVAYVTSTNAHLFITNHGSAGNFRIEKPGVPVEEMVSIPGRIYITPDTSKLLFKPTEITKLLEEARQSGSLQGQFITQHGIGSEGWLDGKMSVDKTGTMGQFIIKTAGETGVLYLTGKDRTVVGEQARGRRIPGKLIIDTMPIKERLKERKLHGVLYETAGKSTFLPDEPDIVGIFKFTSAGDPFEENVYINPRFSLVRTDSTFSEEFKTAMKSTKHLRGVLHIQELEMDIPVSLAKSLNVPLAYEFTAEIEFISGWMTHENPDSEGEFMSDDGIDVYRHSGWKTQYALVEPGVVKNHNDKLFYGFGNCPYDPKIKQKDFLRLRGNDETITFFLRVLRTHCLHNHFEQVQRLLNDDILEIEENEKGHSIFTLNKTNILLTTPKLTAAQAGKISTAVELSVTSMLYINELFQESLDFAWAPDGTDISRSVHFFTKFVLTVVSKTKEEIPSHFVRIMRNLVTTLNTAIVKLNQDKDRLEKCRLCEGDMAITANDKRQLDTLKKFIMQFVRYSSEDNTQTQFDAFYMANLQMQNM